LRISRVTTTTRSRPSCRRRTSSPTRSGVVRLSVRMFHAFSLCDALPASGPFA
jgi:hypothetical protein